MIQTLQTKILMLFIGVAVLTHVMPAQTQIYGANTYQTFSSAGTTNGASSNANFNLYSAVGQPIAISSSTLSQTQAGVLSAVNNGVLVVDNTAPAISFTKPANFKDGDVITVSLDDGVSGTGVDVTKSKIYFRPISQPASAYQSFGLTASTGTNYTATIQNTWHDAMGIEFYFVAVDKKGNANPASGQNPIYYQVPLMNASVVFGAGLPKGSNEANYGLISFPYDLSGKTMGQVLTDGSTVILDHKYTGRMYLYDTVAQAIKEYADNASLFSTVSRGAGYWLLMAESHDNLSLTNQVSPSNTRSNLFVLHLHDKWNLIGNPYPLTMSWNDVLNYSGNSAAASKVSSQLTTFNGGWQPTGTLTPFQGAYVENKSGSSLTLVIPFPGQTSPGGRQVQYQMPSSRNLSDDAWEIPLTVEEPTTGIKNIGGFGMHPMALIGDDWYDNYSPQAPFEMAQLKFVDETATVDRKIKSIDMVRSSEKYKWTFNTTQQKQEVELSWPEVQANGRQLILYDHSTFSLVDMTEVNHYHAKASSIKFSIYYGKDILASLLPDELGISVPYPNPIRKERSVKFNLALPESKSDYEVQLQIFDGTGSLISSQNTTLKAGIHQIEKTFDDKIDNGIYFYRMAAGNSSGNKMAAGKFILQAN